MQGCLLIFFLLSSIQGVPDYADLGGELLSENSHLQHEVADHYLNEIDTGVRGFSPSKSQEARKNEVDTSHGMKKLLKNYNDLQEQAALERPDNPIRNSVFMKHFHNAAGTELYSKLLSVQQPDSVPVHQTDPAHDTTNEKTDAKTDDSSEINADKDSALNVADDPVNNDEEDSAANVDLNADLNVDVDTALYVNADPIAKAGEDGDLEGTKGGETNDEMTDLPSVNVHTSRPVFNEHHAITSVNTLDDTNAEPIPDEKNSEESLADVKSVNVHHSRPIFNEHHMIGLEDEKEDTVTKEENNLEESSPKEDPTPEAALDANFSEEDQILSDEEDSEDGDEYPESERDGRIVNKDGKRRNSNRGGGATRIRSRPVEDTFRPRPVYTGTGHTGPIQTHTHHSEHHVNHVQQTNILSSGRVEGGMKILSDVENSCFDPVTCAAKDTKVEVNILIQKDPVVREEALKQSTSGHVDEEDLNDEDDSESGGLLAWLFG